MSFSIRILPSFKSALPPQPQSKQTGNDVVKAIRSQQK